MALNDDKKKLQDPAYAAGASVRRALSGGTTYDAMGRSYMARGQAAAQVAAPVRGFTKGLVGATPDAPAAPAVAAPRVKFAGTDAMPDSMFKSPIQAPPQRQAPSQRMTLDQAHAAEVNARTATQPSSPQTGMGVPAGAGGAAPGGIVKSKDRNGNSVYTGTGAYATTDPAISGRAGTIGSVQNQNFGNPVVPQAQASIAQPRVASTFGMSVNDPRINDQTAPVARPQGVFRGPDAMAEAYNSREDREARQKQLSDLDSQRFRLEMIASNPGRRGRAALEALGQNAQQRAALIAGGEKLSADAVQGRANRANVLANTGMEQAAATQRQQMQADVTREGNLLDYDAKNRATEASLIEKPQYITDDQRRYVRVGPDGATPVTDAAGNPIQMPQTQQDNSGAVQPKDALAVINKELASLINNPPEMGGDATAYNARIAELRAQQAAYLGGQQAKPPAGYPNAKQAPDGKWYVQKDGATYLVN